MSGIYRDSGAKAFLTVLNLHLYAFKTHKYTALILGNPHAENRENATLKNNRISRSYGGRDRLTEECVEDRAGAIRRTTTVAYDKPEYLSNIKNL